MCQHPNSTADTATFWRTRAPAPPGAPPGSAPLFLFHSTGMALWAAFGHFVLDNREIRQPDLQWWVSRPIAFVGPLLLTMPIILILGRRYTKPARTSASAT